MPAKLPHNANILRGADLDFLREVAFEKKKKKKKERSKGEKRTCVWQAALGVEVLVTDAHALKLRAMHEMCDLPAASNGYESADQSDSQKGI
jgi:hypothetical protein